MGGHAPAWWHDPWAALVHATGCDYGAPYGRFVPYDFWSGVSGRFLLVAALWFWGYYIHHTCHHSPWCLRWGAFHDGLFVYCWRHKRGLPVRRREWRRTRRSDVDAAA